jgi:phosphomannomutase
MKIVADAGNGMAGKIIPIIFDGLPFELIPLYFELDGHFPNHTPNPLIPKNNEMLQKTILEQHADLGLTFDGDADRMFLVDDKGRMVSGTITTALLARYILKQYPGETILYNAICGRIVPKIITEYGGKPQRVRVGHSYIKTYMKETGAIFAGEHSGHYYHRDFFRAESGVLTALMVLSLLGGETKKLSELVDELDIYPGSGEINFTTDNIPAIIERIRNGFTDATSKDELDGMSVWYPTYWFNVRSSKTEPVIRLNVEADTKEILETKLKELMAFMQSMGAIVNK